MPNICFSYPGGPPPGSGTRGVPQPGLRSMPYTCFSYQADVPRSVPHSCFSYSADVPPGVRNRNAAQAAPRDLRRMPFPCYSYPSMCFGYPDDVPRDGGNPGTAQPPPTGRRRMPYGTCFRY